jgi:hypothetical protein
MDPVLTSAKCEVIINCVPFQTEKYIRIPYTIRMWEYRKDGLVLQGIAVIDGGTKLELQRIDKASLPHIYMNPLPTNPVITMDSLSSYYLSLQVPIPLGQSLPKNIFHRFFFRDTVRNLDVTLDGAGLTTRIGENPVVLASPVRGPNWIYMNQSTNKYHYYVVLFLQGMLFRPEAFASDLVQLDDVMGDVVAGDPDSNRSFFCYGDTLYAVSDGIVIEMQDGKSENHGEKKDAPMPAFYDYAGNYIMLNIGGGHYACYAHCVPNSFFVKTGDLVRRGEPLALLGNSGNSDCPHLHFQLVDAPNFFYSNGVPFVLEKYTKVGEMGIAPMTPKTYRNMMMEVNSVVSFD